MNWFEEMKKSFVWVVFVLRRLFLLLVGSFRLSVMVKVVFLLCVSVYLLCIRMLLSLFVEFEVKNDCLLLLLGKWWNGGLLKLELVMWLIWVCSFVLRLMCMSGSVKVMLKCLEML